MKRRQQQVPLRALFLAAECNAIVDSDPPLATFPTGLRGA
jgi:hypothetical protein